jgi:hypothetical protein
MFKIKARKKYIFIKILIGVFCLALTVFPQKLPKEIRGYKVYNAKISVKNETEKSSKTEESEAFVKVSEPEIIDVSLTGITFAISAEIDSVEQTGTIDFLTFHDFRVNNLAIEVEEYKKTFEIKKNQTIVLPEPVKIFVGAGQTLRGALSEVKESKNEWTITGRVFVFGHFKKSLFKFKRVVPVEINLKIKNPLKQLTVISQQKTVNC